MPRRTRDVIKDESLSSENVSVEEIDEKSVGTGDPSGPILSLPPIVIVRDLAELTESTSVDVIKQLMRQGLMATINDVIDFESAAQVAATFGFRVRRAEGNIGPNRRNVSNPTASSQSKNYVLRPPVVTILGHVDHGKTSLLDAIRATNVADKEVGGITQHIGASVVIRDGNKITFLDTPGHEAFTAMRARGARMTDIAVLVVAADDGLMPQTLEAIDHAKAANVPIVVAINKIDVPDADAERVKRQLTERELLPEEWGGETIVVPVSAKVGTGVDDLLENILLIAEIAELKADPEVAATGTVIEARLDRAKGPVATLLIQEGTLAVGDNLVAGDTWGRVKAMLDSSGKPLTEASPAAPVEVLGLGIPPEAGDQFFVATDEKTAKEVLESRRRYEDNELVTSFSLEAAASQIQSGQIKELPIILKCDVQGSTDAVKSVLAQLATDVTRVRILHSNAGTVTETDVLLAKASSAVIIGFNTKIEPGALALAGQQRVEIRSYDIIYRLAEDVEQILLGIAPKIEREVTNGFAEVQEIFSIGKTSKIAGCRVQDGKITRNSKVRVVRSGEIVHVGAISGLKRFKDDVREVASGFECGIGVDGFSDFENGDILESFSIEQS